MSENRLAFAYITAPDKEEARSLGTHLIEKRLAACVNIFDSMESIYRWEGKIETSSEVLLIVKTDERLKEALTEEVMQQHSYDCPCILFFDAEAGNMGYVNWMRSNLLEK